jgi:hypothetical protein
MPLNMQEQNENPEGADSESPRPILRDQELKEGTSRKPLIIVFSVIVLLAVVYLLFKFNIVGGKQAPAPASVVNLPQADTAGPPPLYEPGNVNSKASQGTEAASGQQTPTQAMEKPPVEKPREGLQKVETPVKSVKPPPRHTPVVAGEFTIFTGTFKSKANADRELRRLTAAGLDANVREVRGMYSVSAGSYQNRSEAESFVARNKGLFPNGHHIGKAK